jgi:dolichyl-phosphate-mannose-protein mannosyltransferase
MRRAEVAALLALWIAAGAALQALTTRVADWFVMTDELLYERLALSVARHHSPLPRVHEALIPNVDQLYPLLLSPVFGDAPVWQSLRNAHFLNAFLVTSACIPAYLLVRRVTGRALPAWLAAAASLCVPWLVLSSFLLTEVVAYPAFLWAVYAMLVAIERPSWRHDVLALAGIGLAVSARTQFVVLLATLPLALVLVDGRRSASRHRLLVWAYGLVVAGFAVLLAFGRAASVLGTYGSTLRGNLLPIDSGRSLLEHVSEIALGVGILPFVVGSAWLLAGAARRNAFAALATVTIVLLLVEVTIFDLRFGGGGVRDRYLFYVAPLVLAGLACALARPPWPRLSLALPLVLVAGGFAVSRFPRYDKLNADTPVSTLDDPLLRSLHTLAQARVFLAGLALVLAACFVARRLLAVAVLALSLAAVPAEATYAWVRLFRVPDTAGRPLTNPDPGRFAWLDASVGRRARVTLVPYPTIPGDYFASVGSWWDLEFWNVSAARSAGYPDEFEGTPSTFPKLRLRFDTTTGAANASPTEYVALSSKETRFRISGAARGEQYNVLLVDAARPWRTDWLTSGLTDDGWTKPGVVARVRVFAVPGQRTAVSRSLSLALLAPPTSARIAFTVVSNVARWDDSESNSGTVVGGIRVCVPRRGYTDVRISTPVEGMTYGDMRNASTFGLERRLGLFVSSIALADEIGPACRP